MSSLAFWTLGGRPTTFTWGSGGMGDWGGLGDWGNRLMSEQENAASEKDESLERKDEKKSKMGER